MLRSSFSMVQEEESHASPEYGASVPQVVTDGLPQFKSCSGKFCHNELYVCSCGHQFSAANVCFVVSSTFVEQMQSQVVLQLQN